jgi:hypothetical protein
MNRCESRIAGRAALLWIPTVTVVEERVVWCVDRGVLVLLVKWSASVPWNAEARGDESKGRVDWNMDSK